MFKFMGHTHSDSYRPPIWWLILFSGAKPCPLCGQVIEVSRIYRNLVGLAGLFGLGFALACTIFLRSSWPCYIAICLALLSQYLVARFAPMVIVSQREQTRRKWAAAGLLVLLLALFTLSYFSHSRW